MDKDLHVDEEYKKSFNEGYILAKELGMTTDSIKDISAGNNRMHAIKSGIEEFDKESSKMKDPRKELLDKLNERDQEIQNEETDLDKDKGKEIDR